MNEMRIYVASLSDYNNGRLEGKWLDLADYSDASELMEAIQEMLDDLTKKYNDGEVREEWAVHDYEGIPSTLASEYMGEQDFQQLYDIAEVADDRGIPVEVLVERAGDTGSDDYQALADSLIMSVSGNDESDIVYEYEEQYGGLGNDFWSNHIYIDDVTERVMYGEDVDQFRDNILSENPDMDEDEAERQAEEMADEEAERREDLTTYLEEMGYGDEIPSFVSKDYEGAWKRSLSYDFDVIHHDGEMYVFSNNYGVGGTILSGMIGAYIGYKVGRAKPQKKGFETEKRIGRKIKGAFSKKKKYAKGGGVDNGLLKKIKVGNILVTNKGNYEITDLQEDTALLGKYDGGYSYFEVKNEDGETKYIKISREKNPKMFLNDRPLYSSSWQNAEQIFAKGGGVSKFPVTIERRINEINELLPKVNDADEIAGGYFGSTYYTYVQLTKPIEIKGKYVYIHSANGRHDMTFEKRYNVNKLGDEFDGRKALNYDLSKILKAFKSVLKDKYKTGGGVDGKKYYMVFNLLEFKEKPMYNHIATSKQEVLDILLESYESIVGHKMYGNGYTIQDLDESDYNKWGVYINDDYAFVTANPRNFDTSNTISWQQKGRKMAEGGKILQEISTHKAVKKGDKIYIYIKGMPIENAEDKRLAKKYPHWYEDELIRTIPAENEDDLFYIFENLQEENRINLSGYARGGGVDEFKIGDKVEFSVPYLDSKFDYKGTIIGLKGSYAIVEYYEPLNDLTLRTDMDLSRLTKTKYSQGGGVDSIQEGDEVIWRGNKYLLTKIEKSTKGGFYDKKYYLSSNEVGISDAILDSLKDVKKHKYSQGGGVSGLDDLIRG